MISDADKQSLREHLAEHLTGDVRIVLFTKEQALVELPGQGPDIAGEMSVHARELAADLAECSDHITVAEFDIGAPEAVEYRVDKAPAFAPVHVQDGAVTDYGIRYYGLPAGHDAAAFLADLVDVGNATTQLSAATQEALGALTTDVHLQVFVTPT